MQNVVLWLRDLENAGGPRKPAREDLDTGLDEPGLSFISSLLWLPVEKAKEVSAQESGLVGGNGLGNGEKTVGLWRKACNLETLKEQDWRKAVAFSLNLCSGQLRSPAPWGHPLSDSMACVDWL